MHARSPFVLVINTQRNDRREFLRGGGTPFLREALSFFLAGESRIRVFPPAATGLQSITRVRYSRNPSAIIHCVYAYDPRWFTRADVTRSNLAFVH